MATTMFDTYKAVKNLEAAGLVEEQAAAIVAVMRWAITGRYTSYAEYFRMSDDTESS